MVAVVFVLIIFDEKTQPSEFFHKMHQEWPEWLIGLSEIGKASVKRTTMNVNAESTGDCVSCVKVEVAVLGSPSLIVLMVSVDVKQR